MNTRKIRQVAKATRHHQKTPFTTKKEITAGGNSKNKAKGFSGGASAGLPAQALGLSLHGSAILLEIGSDLVVKSHTALQGDVAKLLLLASLEIVRNQSDDQHDCRNVQQSIDQPRRKSEHQSEQPCGDYDNCDDIDESR